jgi:hypothetical protein
MSFLDLAISLQVSYALYPVVDSLSKQIVPSYLHLIFLSRMKGGERQREAGTARQEAGRSDAFEAKVEMLLERAARSAKVEKPILMPAK